MATSTWQPNARPGSGMPSATTPLEAAIPAGRSILVDTSVVLTYIGSSEPTSDLARQLFDAFAATGRNPVALSTVTVAELMVRPFRRGPAAVANCGKFVATKRRSEAGRLTERP